jgi:hypothetical protein
MTTTNDYKTQARRLRDALVAQGVTLSHSGALELVARQNGVRDWNTLSAAEPKTTEAADGRPRAPFQVGTRVRVTVHGAETQGRLIGVEETIKPELWRVTLAFDTPVDLSTSRLFKAERRRLTTVVGADGRSRRLTGTETGVLALSAA